MIKDISRKTKTYKVFSALQAGEKLTASEANHRFGVKNIRAEATRIRNSGFVVVADKRVAGNNVKVTEYRLSGPTREMVAMAYKAKRLGLGV